MKSPIRIPRFICLSCGRTCSRQTFSTTYYLKRPELLAATANQLVGCSCHRQIARSTKAAKTSITRMAERLGRHALLFHTRCLRELPDLQEPIVHDHFETFIRRQDHALGIGTAVGAVSRFVYDVDPAPHKGSGRRPAREPDERDAIKIDRSYVRSIRRSLRLVLPHVSTGSSLVLRADGRGDYKAALWDEALETRVVLETYPNSKRGPKGSPRSPEAIRRDFAMFPVDQLHQLIRHSFSDDKRETIAFGRRLESILGRAHLMAVWKNFVKIRSERKPDHSTPAMYVGLTDNRWPFERIFTRRLFPAREAVSDSALWIYRKLWTRSLPQLEKKHAG